MKTLIEKFTAQARKTAGDTSMTNVGLMLDATENAVDSAKNLVAENSDSNRQTVVEDIQKTIQTVKDAAEPAMAEAPAKAVAEAPAEAPAEEPEDGMPTGDAIKVAYAKIASAVDLAMAVRYRAAKR